MGRQMILSCFLYFIYRIMDRIIMSRAGRGARERRRARVIETPVTQNEGITGRDDPILFAKFAI